MKTTTTIKYYTKADELALIRETAEKLGADSYLGTWLSQISYELESLIRSDIFPEISLADASKRAFEIVNEAECKAEEIRKQSVAAHGKSVRETEATIRAIKASALRSLDAAEKDIAGMVY